MTLNPFNKDLLEFIYHLTKTPEFLNIDKAAEHFNSAIGGKISTRTIRRWFSYLKDNGFGYFLEFNYYPFNLLPVTVFYYNIGKEKLSKLLPHSYHITICTDISRYNKVSCVSYLIPYEKFEEFKSFLGRLEQKGFVEHVSYFAWHDLVNFYLPLHNNVTADGLIELKDTTIDNAKLELLKENLIKEHVFGINEYVRKNPFIIPVLFEYSRECWSSSKVWFAIKENLGDSIWKYIRDIKRRIKKKDGTGVKFVQETMNFVNKNPNLFFKQISIVYDPVYNKKNCCAILHLTLKDRQSIVELARKIASNSLISKIYLPIEKSSKQFMAFLLTNNVGFCSILRVLNGYLSDDSENKVLIMDNDETDFYWKNYKTFLKFDYAKYFDVEKLKWKYLFNDSVFEESKTDIDN